MRRQHHPALQRLAHWQGEKLRSRDLNDAAFFGAHLRWSHNRALHNAFGIAQGLDVVADESGQNLVVQPGLAYDAFGRELLLFEPRGVSLPTRETPARGLLLLICYRSTERYPRAGEQTEACLPGCPSGSPEDPCFAWCDPDCWDPLQGVPLTRLLPGGQLSAAAERPALRPLARPHLAAGSTISPGTAWRLWRWTPEHETPEDENISLRAVFEPSSKSPLPLGLEAEVDTSAAGFTSTPCYFAWPGGSLWDAGQAAKLLTGASKEATSAPVPAGLAALVALQVIQARFSHLHDASPSGFVYRLWFPQFTKLWTALRPHSDLLEHLLLNLARTRLGVGWLGIQMDSQRWGEDHGNP